MVKFLTVCLIVCASIILFGINLVTSDMNLRIERLERRIK